MHKALSFIHFRFTYEIAPVFVLLEYVTLKKMREIIGWPGGSGDGIFSPGIYISNFLCLILLTCHVINLRKANIYFVFMIRIPRLCAYQNNECG